MKKDKIIENIAKLNELYIVLEQCNIGKENLTTIQDTIDLLYQIIKENKTK